MKVRELKDEANKMALEKFTNEYSEVFVKLREFLEPINLLTETVRKNLEPKEFKAILPPFSKIKQYRFKL